MQRNLKVRFYGMRKDVHHLFTESMANQLELPVQTHWKLHSLEDVPASSPLGYSGRCLHYHFVLTFPNFLYKNFIIIWSVHCLNRNGASGQPGQALDATTASCKFAPEDLWRPAGTCREYVPTHGFVLLGKPQRQEPWGCGRLLRYLFGLKFSIRCRAVCKSVGQC